jgi:transcription initiation factor TFIIIB Brf1 subunit/transcription initiation factor TFIIB
MGSSYYQPQLRAFLERRVREQEVHLPLWERACLDCGARGSYVYDEREGDTVCTNCGLVADAHAVVETPEWRHFADSTDPDPSRVGAAGDTRTFIGNVAPTAGKKSAVSVAGIKRCHQRTQGRAADSDTELLTRICRDVLQLNENTTEFAIVVYRDAHAAHGTSRGGNHRAFLAACVIASCMVEKFPRTIEEVCAAFSISHQRKFNSALCDVLEAIKGAQYFSKIITADSAACNVLARLVYDFDAIPNDSDARWRVVKAARAVRDQVIHFPEVAGKKPSKLNGIFLYIACCIAKVPVTREQVCAHTKTSLVTLNRHEEIIQSCLIRRKQQAIAEDKEEPTCPII